MNVKDCISETILEEPSAICIIAFKGAKGVSVKWSDVPLEVLTYGSKILDIAIQDSLKKHHKLESREELK